MPILMFNTFTHERTKSFVVVFFLPRVDSELVCSITMLLKNLAYILVK